MNMTEAEIKAHLEQLFPLQLAEQELVCPRCGRRELYRGDQSFLNSLSRYAHVYICEKCWFDETLREIDHQPIPLSTWSAALELLLSGGRLSGAETKANHSPVQQQPTQQMEQGEEEHV